LPRAPTDPTIRSSSAAIASSARAIRSPFNTAASIPNASSTAHPSAHSLTRHNSDGEVNRFATSASITCPCDRIATSRIGPARSMIPARSSRRQYSATTGNTPSTFSTLGCP
jgi:hypothetical protein